MGNPNFPFCITDIRQNFCSLTAYVKRHNYSISYTGQKTDDNAFYIYNENTCLLTGKPILLYKIIIPRRIFLIVTKLLGITNNLYNIKKLYFYSNKYDCLSKT